MRRRIQLVGVLAATLAIGLFGVPLAVAVVVLLRSDERGELERLADTAAVRVAPDLVAGRPVPASRTPRTTTSPSRSTPWTGGGWRAPGPAPPTTRSGGRRRAVARHGGGQLVVAVPVTSGERVVAVVRAASRRPGSTCRSG